MNYSAVIPVFIPNYGCKNRCVFCDQWRTTGKQEDVFLSQQYVVSEVEKWLNERIRNKEKVQVAFFGGSFTALPFETQAKLLEALWPYLKAKKVHSIRVSTRPDALSQEVVRLLKEYGVRTVELGVQSMDPEVLRISKRGYSPETVKIAVELLKWEGFEVGIQIMIGLPGDTPQRFLRTVKEVIILEPHFVRIYPTLVLKGTELEDWYYRGAYKPLGLEEAVSLAKEALRAFEEVGIKVIRIGLQPSVELERGLVAGPYHPSFGELVKAELYYDRVRKLLQKQKEGKVLLKVNPKDLSLLKGHGGEKWKRLEEAFPMLELDIQSDPNLKRGEVEVQKVH